MNTQQQRILNALIDSGWTVLEQETSTPDWWAAETWILKSSWSPQNCRLYLTFLVDPQWEGERKESQGIWALKASLVKPTQWQEQDGEIALSLGRGWEEQLSEFMQSVAKLRNKRGDAPTLTGV